MSQIDRHCGLSDEIVRVFGHIDDRVVYASEGFSYDNLEEACMEASADYESAAMYFQRLRQALGLDWSRNSLRAGENPSPV